MAEQSRGELGGGTVRERPRGDGGSGERRVMGSGGRRNALRTQGSGPGAGRARLRQRDANADETQG